jgi:putative tricarboxylic transport membrane protein
MVQRLKPAIPYLIGIAFAAVFYVLAGRISYTARPGQLGPDFWPRIAILMIAVVCLYEIIRVLATGTAGSKVEGIAEQLDKQELDATAAEADTGSRIGLLMGGIVLTVAYAALVPVFGFLLASYLFLILFMYLGGARNHVAVWTSSTIGMLVFAFIFLKVVYVSVPRGEPPFDQFTQLVMDLLQVK